MAEINDVYGSIYQNLLDVGFDIHTAAQCMGIVKEGRHSDILLVLSKHRRSLLDSLHAEQRQIASNYADAMQEMLDGSKERLHTDVVDVYWLHNPMDVEKWTLHLIPLAKSGQIKTIGVSNHNLAEIKRANEILATEGLKVSAVQNHFSLPLQPLHGQ